MDVVDIKMHGCSISDYDFNLPQEFIEYYEYGNFVRFNTSGSEGGIITLDATTCCGTREVFTGYLIVGGKFLLNFNPNPATGNTTILLTTMDEKEPGSDIKWDLEVYSLTQNLITGKQGIKGPMKYYLLPDHRR